MSTTASLPTRLSLPERGRLRLLASAVVAMLLATLTAVGFSVSDASAQQPFACASDAGVLTWSDDGASKYWVYKSTDGVNYSWIGRTLGATTFTDAAPVVGATYQVHYQGLPRVDCTIVDEPAGGDAFACASDAGVLTWSDDGASKYWVYKSTDGVNYSWIGRTLGATTFTDAAPTLGATYQVHYQGLPRVDCTIVDEPAASDPFACEASNGVISWTDHGDKTYWVYRSTDGVNYAWLGRAIDGALTLTDPNPSGATYQVHYQGLPRINCTSPVSYGPPPANAVFDYQIGQDYPLQNGTTVVSRDWFGGQPAANAYSICYVNAWQTQDDADFVDRPDETSNWPDGLILSDEDPNWPGEYLVNVGTDALRTAALAHLAPMMDTCASKGFDAIEFDNLDSWTRFNNLPFDMSDTVIFATMLTDYTHSIGLASAQKNTAELIAAGLHTDIGFDFAVVEECGTYTECGAFVAGYGSAIVAVEYTDAGFDWACTNYGDQISIVRRDQNVTPPSNNAHVLEHCPDVDPEPPAENLLQNGDFGASASWFNCGVAASYTIAGGQLTTTATSNAAACVYQEVTGITVGTNYELSCSSTIASGYTSVTLNALDANFVSIDSISKDGASISQSMTLVAPTGTALIAVTIYGEGNSTHDECVLSVA